MSQDQWPEGTQELLEVIKEILWPGESVEMRIDEHLGSAVFKVMGNGYGVYFLVSLSELVQARHLEIIGERVADWFQEELANYREVQE